MMPITGSHADHVVVSVTTASTPDSYYTHWEKLRSRWNCENDVRSSWQMLLVMWRSAAADDDGTSLWHS